jgi:MarR family transcriptional regulator, transcriptional regulator for hemolysin
MLMVLHAHKPPLSPARELGFALNDVARLLRTYSDQRARELGTTRAQWAVLSRLQRCEGVKQNELAEALDLAPITLGRLIDKLTAAGLVERRDDAADRRANRLYLTEKAAPTLVSLGALAEDVMGRALAGLGRTAIDAMQDGLKTIKANLKNELNSGASAK